MADEWVEVQNEPRQIIMESETQGRARVVPAQIRVEKSIGGQMVSVIAEDPDTLEERTATIDEIQTAVADQAETAAPQVVEVPQVEVPTFDSETGENVVDSETGEPVTEPLPPEAHQTVVTEEGSFTDAEWSSRFTSDTIVTEDGQQITTGVVEQPIDSAGEPVAEVDPEEQAQAISDAADAQLEQSVAEANEAAAEEPIETEQIVYDTADSLDSPGQSAGGTLVVPEGTETPADAAQAMADTSQLEENQRLFEAEQAQFEGAGSELKAEEPAIAEPAGELSEEEAAATEEPAPEEATVPDDFIPAEPPAEEAPPAEAPAAEETPTATPAAEAKAEELGVDLTTVEGTGTDGKILVGDVEAAADAGS